MNIGPRGNPMCMNIQSHCFLAQTCNYNLMKFTYNLFHVLLQLWQDKDVTLNPGGYNPKTLTKEVSHIWTWMKPDCNWNRKLNQPNTMAVICPPLFKLPAFKSLLFPLEVWLALKSFFNRALSCDVITFKITKENRKQPPCCCTMR